MNTLYKKAMSGMAECCMCLRDTPIGKMIRINELGDLVCSISCLDEYQRRCPHEPENVDTKDGIAKCTACDSILAVDPARP